MIYTQLTQEYQDDVIAEALYSREREHFHYDVDRKNFIEMLKTLPAGEYKDQIQKRANETASRMNEVDTIYVALETTGPKGQAMTDAIVRTKAKRDALEAAALVAKP